ncbi:hypothetical protein Pan44_39040 [Caulifigura coniformis]|uniref:PRC-barrel domain protein n=1 Tax=Caulifigura coniformis TaxID=2527983 RepID=A0A517SIA5_9PLAN|nr:hypothetical protein [Caulifigura coniformis]QDT55856.1 hypothetical protein Pan44_39040 [Caulifigura coniformis]
MNRRSWLIVGAMACLACGIGNAQGPAVRKASDVGELSGRIVAITLVSDSEDLVLLSKVSEKTLGGKTFLSGDGVDDGETADWRNGAVVYIPVDDIQQVVTFPDLKAYHKNLEARQGRLEGKAASSRLKKGSRT